jgi:thiol-disulfide isomerase/thioredoxin
MLRRALWIAATCLLVLGAALASADEPPRDERGWTVVEGGLASGLADVLGGGPYPTPFLKVPLIGKGASAADLDTLITGPTFLFYYSATCPHCQEVAPEVARLAERLDGRVSVLGIASGSSSGSEVRAFAKDYGLKFPNWRDFARKFASTNNISSTPTMLLVQPTDDGFETVAEYRPFLGGFGTVAEIRARALVGEAPFGAFEPGHYVGTQACGACHVHEYQSWGLTHHSTAYWTLYEREEAENPDCIGCHVVGFGQPSGFELAKYRSPVADVGCEACHGPGGPHAGDRQPVAASREVCVTCHDADHSIRFDLNRALPHLDHYRAANLNPEEFREAREDVVQGRAERPLLAFPEGANVGSAACAECHATEHKAWKKTPHAGASKTLKRKGSAQDVACVRCHAVKAVDAPQTAGDFHPDGVGCEACHGPGEQHVAAQGGRENIVGLGETCPECIIESICTRCHTPEQDADWNLKKDLPKVGH